MLLGLLVTLLGQTLSQSTFSPARPPSIPLAVRSPYLSTWQDSTEATLQDNGHNFGCECAPAVEMP
jgi:hypothetical protein